MNNTVAMASARHAPSTAPSDEVSTNRKAVKEYKPKLNPQSLAQRVAAPVPIPPLKSQDAGPLQPRPESDRDALATAIAKSQRSRSPCPAPSKCSATSTPAG